jgi:uncharacterized protein (DUF488 family)
MLDVMPEPVGIWTVGHSNHAFDRFVELLRGERIECLVDVRSYPYSRFAPHFNHEELRSALPAAGVRYLYLGVELGGRPQRDEHYDADGHALYEPMSREPAFREAIDRLVRGAEQYRIALMCSEGQPDSCHRHLLVSKVLKDRGAVVRHILPDGSVSEMAEGEPALQPQGSLLEEELVPWRSTQSVLHRRRLSTSSVG